MSKRALIVAYFVVLFVLHQDFWWKGDATLVFGVLPISLAYHIAWTLLVAVGWVFVGKYCWPEKLDDASGEASGAPDGKKPTAP